MPYTKVKNHFTLKAASINGLKLKPLFLRHKTASLYQLLVTDECEAVQA
jgi:hypothetical protein